MVHLYYIYNARDTPFWSGTLEFNIKDNSIMNIRPGTKRVYDAKRQKAVLVNIETP